MLNTYDVCTKGLQNYVSIAIKTFLLIYNNDFWEYVQFVQ